MKKSTAAAIAVLLTCPAYVVVVSLTERIFCQTAVQPGRERRAAIAIRDNVTPFQKWGSMQFTQPYQESEAFCYGYKQIRFTGIQE
jgi:hypothetical protein